MTSVTEISSAPATQQDVPRNKTPDPGFQDIFSALTGQQQMFAASAGNNVAGGWSQANGNSLGISLADSTAPQQNANSAAQNSPSSTPGGNIGQPGNPQDQGAVSQNNVSQNQNAPATESSQAQGSGAVSQNNVSQNQNAPAKENGQNGPKNVSSANKASPKTNATASASNSDQAGSAAGTSQSQNTSAPNTADNKTQTVTASNIDKIAQQLKTLGLSEEQIKKVVDLLNKEAAAGSSNLLNALNGLLNPSGAGAISSGLAQNTTANQQLLSQLNEQGGSIQDLMVKAGMTVTDAKSLMSNLKAGVQMQATKHNSTGVGINSLAETNSKKSNDTSGNTNTPKDASGNSNSFDLTTKLDKSNLSPVALSNSTPDAKNVTTAATTPVLDAKSKIADASNAISDAKNKFADATVSSNSLDPSSNSSSTASIANPQSGTNNAAIQQSISSDSAVTAVDQTKATGTVKVSSDVAVQSMTGGADTSSKAANEISQPANASASANASIEKPIVNQIIEKFSIQGIGQQNEINIKLTPPDLGTVRINITSSGDMVKTTLIAENSSVKQAIENNLNQLRNSMSDQGLKVESFTVLVGGNPGNKGQNPQQQSGAYPAGTQYPESSIPQDKKAVTSLSPKRSFYSDSQSFSIFA